jgi:hypothetical protein
VIKIPGSEKIEDEKDQRDDTVVNTIPQEWLCGGGKKLKMTAKQNKCGNVPAHNKHSHGNANKSEAEDSNAAQVFRGEKERVCTIIFHEGSVNCTKKHKPEYKQHLVPPEMQEQ